MSRSIGLLTLLTGFLLVTTNSCSPVKFSAGDQTTNVTPSGPSSQTIGCSPRLNGSSTSLTMAPGDPNPTVTANCTPSNVDYLWTVTRNGSTVTVNGLSGSVSTPDFSSLSDGTYLITLTATLTDWKTYKSPTPLTVVVKTPNPGMPSISCDPRLNGNQTSVTLSSGGSNNPSIAANCTPANVSYNWSVTRGGTPVMIAGLSGSTATPQFRQAGPGTYSITLNATQADYNAYTSPSPLTVIVPQVTGTPVSETHNITVANNKLDILLIIDDSASMLEDNKRLAARLTNFVNSLSAQGFDWQMCVTLTHAMAVSGRSGLYWGASYNWTGNSNNPAWILKSGTANTVSIFTNTINDIGAGWDGTDDERAIKAAYWHLWNGDPRYAGGSGCYRDDAGLAVLILSDEDERSIGGDQTQAYYDHERNKPLESDDLPQTYVNYVKQVFGSSKRLSVNSIIVKPGDSACMAQQDAEGSKSHYGVKYAELSNLTQGYVGSICDPDYSNNLNYFKDSIVRSQASIPLKCQPIGNVSVNVSPMYSYTTTLQGNLLVFNPKIPAGTTVNLQYTCP